MHRRGRRLRRRPDGRRRGGPGAAGDLHPALLRAPRADARRRTRGAPCVDRAVGLAFRFEPRGGLAGAVESAEDERRRFVLQIARVKAAVRSPERETDFVLVSRSVAEGAGPAVRAARSRGEERVRASGLGYTVVRPGDLLDEAGGYRALVFDQGDRVERGIAAADVADIVLRSLHDPSARCVSFDVCHEYQSSEYELVGHVPDRTNNYLGPALARLERFT